MHDHAPLVGSIVIVTYNCRDYIRECLSSLTACRERWEVIVVDNGSSDGTLTTVRSGFPWVHLVDSGANIGFAAACNAGAAVATTPWVFFLNPDTIVTDGALDTLIESATLLGATVMAPRLNGGDGRYQAESAELRLPTFRQLLSESFLLHRLLPRAMGASSTTLPGFDPTKRRLVEYPIGAALLVRRDVFAAQGGFDERFHPIWFEDIDLCRRLGEAGHAIWYEPSALIVHVRQHTLGLFTTTAVRAMFNANQIRYARKHYAPWQAGVLRGATAAGTMLRAVLRIPHPRVALGHLRLAWRMIRHSDELRWYVEDIPAARIDK